MIITIFAPKDVFTSTQQKQLASLGEVRYTPHKNEMPIGEIIKLAKGSEVLGLDPDNFGGFGKARERITELLETLPDVKGIALATTSFGWIDLAYCKKRGIIVSNVPGYSRESVAEHTLTFLLCAAKRVILTDRRTQKNAYKLEMGFELTGKTLGIIGLGNIGSRTAELAMGIGMKVIAYNHSPKNHPGVTMVSLDELLTQSDAIAFHTTHTDANHGFFGVKELAKVKKGVIIVNTADEAVVDEKAMAQALKDGRVDTYICEGTLFEDSPLQGVERAIGLKGFGYYTKEAIANLWAIFVDAIGSHANGKPKYTVG